MKSLDANGGGGPPAKKESTTRFQPIRNNAKKSSDKESQGTEATGKGFSMPPISRTNTRTVG